MVIDIKNVSWIREDRWILKDVSWQVRQGEHWAIVGLNGSGKTTLLNMINGYQWPTSGEINVLGHQFGRIDLRELRKWIGWVSSSLQEKFYGSDLAEEIVLSGKFASIGLYDQTDETDVERARTLLNQLGAGHLARQPYRTLSQGEKQKVLIARALFPSPRLLILDEPCTGLDVFAREQLLSSIEQIGTQPDSPTLLYVTHHIEEILPLFSHTLLMRRGEIHSAGRTEEVLSSANLSAFFEAPVEVRWQDHRAWVHVLARQVNP